MQEVAASRPLIVTGGALPHSKSLNVVTDTDCYIPGQNAVRVEVAPYGHSWLPRMKILGS
jgi:hypothetical protein